MMAASFVFSSLFLLGLSSIRSRGVCVLSLKMTLLILAADGGSKLMLNFFVPTICLLINFIENKVDDLQFNALASCLP